MPFREALAAEKRIAIDLAKTSAIDARFLGLLLMVRKQLRLAGNDLEFTGISPKMARISALTKLAICSPGMRALSSVQTIDATLPACGSRRPPCCAVEIVALLGFRGGLLELFHRWNTQEEYSHGYLIPFVTAWFMDPSRSAPRQYRAAKMDRAGSDFACDRASHCRRIERNLHSFSDRLCHRADRNSARSRRLFAPQSEHSFRSRFCFSQFRCLILLMPS